jgi:hypothetical protein
MPHQVYPWNRNNRFSSSPTRVVLGVQFLHSLLRHVSVNLCGAEVTVTEQQLDYAQICTMIKQMSCKRMA